MNCNVPVSEERRIAPVANSTTSLLELPCCLPCKPPRHPKTTQTRVTTSLLHVHSQHFTDFIPLVALFLQPSRNTRCAGRHGDCAPAVVPAHVSQQLVQSGFRAPTIALVGERREMQHGSGQRTLGSDAMMPHRTQAAWAAGRGMGTHAARARASKRTTLAA